MEKEKIRVLYLDDEINNLVSFKATFRNLFNVFIANNHEEAVSVLEQVPVHVVIADQVSVYISLKKRSRKFRVTLGLYLRKAKALNL